MKRPLRIVLIGAGALVLLVTLSIGAAVLFINPNDYKPQIEALALAATGKKLTLQGDLSLAFFPGISIEAGPAVLADAPTFGAVPFARVEKVSASVALVPLFSRKVEIGAVGVSGVRLNLVVDKAGKANWDMGDNQAKNTPPSAGSNSEKNATSPTGKDADISALSLGVVTFNDIQVTYIDMRSGSNVEVVVPKFRLDSFKLGEKTNLAFEALVKGITPQPVSLELKAAFTIPADMVKGSPLTITGKVDDTPFTFKGTAAAPKTSAGSAFSLSGDFDADAVTLDRYFPSPATNAAKRSGNTPSASGPNAPSTAAPDGDDSIKNLLRTIFMDLRVSVKSVTVKKVPITNIKAFVKNNGNMLTVKPFTMVVAGGALSLEATLDPKGKNVRAHFAGDWKNAQAGQLVKILSGKEHLSGTLNVGWNITATGLAWPAMSKSLAGKATLSLAEGKLPAFALIPKGIPGLPATTLDIDVVRCVANWTIASGIAKNNDLALKAVTLGATGEGQINIPAQTVDYKVSVELPTIKQLPNLTVLPLVITGPLSSPVYSVDQPALLRDAAKSLLDPTTKTGKKVQKGLGKMLKGLVK